MTDISRFPKDGVTITVNGRTIEIIVVAARPDEVKGNAVLNYAVDAQWIANGNAPVRRLPDDSFLAILSGRDSEKNIFEQIKSATVASLLRMSNFFVDSAVLTIDPSLDQALGVERIEILAFMLHGINQYVQEASEKSLSDFVSQIIISDGPGLLLQWFEEGTLLSNIIRNPPNKNTGLALRPPDRAGIRMPRQETQLAREPNPLQRKWLKEIGRALIKIDDNTHFYRDSPFAPTLPHERDFNVVFDAQTGDPISIKSGHDQMDPFDLNEGEAAVHIKYYEVGNRGHIAVDGGFVASDTPIGDGVPESIMGVVQFAPILPTADVHIEEIGDGIKIITPDKSVDSFNQAFMDYIHSSPHTRNHVNMTIWIRGIGMPIKGEVALAEYWAQKSGQMSAADIEFFLLKRTMGSAQCDLYIDKNGRFVGAAMHMNWENSPRGTVYRIGSTAGTGSRASDISFRRIKMPNGKILNVPISYKWQGREGLSLDSFLRWYDSEIFLKARESMVTEDRLSEIMFAGMHPAVRAIKLVNHLKDNPQDMQPVNELYLSLVGPDISSEARKCGAGYLLKCIEYYLKEHNRFDKTSELTVAYLEFLMRKTLGEEKVDEILAPGSDGSLGPGGGTPQLPGGGAGESTGSPSPSNSFAASAVSAGPVMNPVVAAPALAPPVIATPATTCSGAAMIGAIPPVAVHL